MGKYYSINPETCTQEELLQAIIECENKADFYHTEEQAVKIFLNSIYGAIASKYYTCNNISIAESITLQGQNLIKYSVTVINRYFTEDWPADVETHGKIADYMKKIYPDFDTDSFMRKAACKLPDFETMQIYGDTDSAYISLKTVIDACQIPIEWQTDFILAVNECVLDGYLNYMFDKYAEEWNCPANKEKFELEKVARSVIMLAKKKYVMDIAWTDDGTFHKPLHKNVFKGIELVQGSTPEFCRKEMKAFILYIVDEINNGRVPSYSDIIAKLHVIKSKFSMQSPNNVSKSFKVSEYEKYVKNDKGERIEFFDSKVDDDGEVKANPCPIHVRGAAIYNNMLNTVASRYKSKYSFIRKGDKVRFYYTENEGVFSFIPDSFPMEFAPKMDIDEQFNKMILDPLNRIIVALGFNEVPANLAYTINLFSDSSHNVQKKAVKEKLEPVASYSLF